MSGLLQDRTEIQQESLFWRNWKEVDTERKFVSKRNLEDNYKCNHNYSPVSD